MQKRLRRLIEIASIAAAEIEKRLEELPPAIEDPDAVPLSKLVKS
jgi:hypothetical protein